MTDHTMRRLQAIAIIGAAVLLVVVVSSASTGCMGCGSIQFEDPEQAAAYNEQVEESVDRQIRFAIVGMTVISIAGLLAQFAWKRHKNEKPVVPVFR